MEALCDYGYPMPPGFWLSIQFNESLDFLVPDKRFPAPSGPLGIDKILQAISDSYNKDDFIARANQWAAGITGKVDSLTDNKRPAIDFISMVSKYNCFTVDNELGMNMELNKRIRNNSSDTAKCVYHTLKVSMAIQNLVRRNGGGGRR